MRAVAQKEKKRSEGRNHPLRRTGGHVRRNAHIAMRALLEYHIRSLSRGSKP
jgi:hypothetical protein